ncbi:hypothetical protein A6R68_09868, partial [Neotoma lepida]
MRNQVSSAKLKWAQNEFEGLFKQSAENVSQYLTVPGSLPLEAGSTKEPPSPQSFLTKMQIFPCEIDKSVMMLSPVLKNAHDVVLDSLVPGTIIENGAEKSVMMLSPILENAHDVVLGSIVPGSIIEN